MSTTIEIEGGVGVGVSAGPAKTVRLDVWVGRGGSTALLSRSEAIAIANVLLSTAGVPPAGVAAPACIACERNEHDACGGSESGCGCAARGHA